MRLFFGISLPEPVRRAVCERAQACQAVIPGRYVRDENYHITLAFLGDVPEHRVCEAENVLKRCIASFPAPHLTVGETSYFGRAQNAILIARVHSNPPLDALHDELLRALKTENLPFDNGPFSPHITLARHARSEGALLPGGNESSFVPAHAHLYLSARNEQDILTYTPIASVRFSH